MTRDLTLMLRKMRRSPVNGNRTSSGGVSVLLRVVLSLRGGSVADSPALADVMGALLNQLQLSWLDPDRRVTKDILDIVLIFVSSLEGEEENREVAKRPAWDVKNFDRGAVTKIIHGK